jgi:hypothetical protein
MSAFDQLEGFFEKGYGAPRFNMREGSAARQIAADEGDIKYMSKDDVSEAKKTLEDHNKNALERLVTGIRRNKSESQTQSTQKALMKVQRKEGAKPVGRPRDPNAAYKNPAIYGARGRRKGSEIEEMSRFATAAVGMRHGDTRSSAGSDWRPGMGDAPEGSDKFTKRNAYVRFLQHNPKRWKQIKDKAKGKDSEKAIMNMQKGVSPALARLLSAAAGWALSADTASHEVPPHMAQEWERTQNREEKRKLQEEMIRKLKGLRKSDDGTFLDDLAMLYKDHAPVPPRMGLMWDAVKHRWTRPEKLGRTVWEVQGKKRMRGSGTGVHERSVSRKGAGGKGAGSMEAGRRFRSVADAGQAQPHDKKRIGQHPKSKIEERKKRGVKNA